MPEFDRIIERGTREQSRNYDLAYADERSLNPDFETEIATDWAVIGPVYRFATKQESTSQFIITPQALPPDGSAAALIGELWNAYPNYVITGTLRVGSKFSFLPGGGGNFQDAAGVFRMLP